MHIICSLLAARSLRLIYTGWLPHWHSVSRVSDSLWQQLAEEEEVSVVSMVPSS